MASLQRFFYFFHQQVASCSLHLFNFFHLFFSCSVVQDFDVRLWFPVRDFRSSVVEGSSACLCSSSMCFVLFFIVHKFLLFFSLACICQLFFGLHLHGFGLIVLFLQSYNCLVLFFAFLLSWIFCFLSFITGFDGWIVLTWFFVNHIIFRLLCMCVF